ncbi:MAG: hypothetical protein HRU19_13165 [Pseudobacteriovorax sp.]|nr:hypothetical protein [Pseudobacteriovorax sp.]
MKLTSLFTLIFSLLTLMSSSEAFAKVNRNAGRSSPAGMGLDLAWYCKHAHGSQSQIILLGNKHTDWRCTKGSQLVGISISHACRAHYGNNASSRLGPAKGSGDWYCALGLNLTWFCKQKFGSRSRAVKLFSDDPTSWRCERSGDYLNFSMNEACRSHYGSRAFSRSGVHEDPEAYTCEIR